MRAEVDIRLDEWLTADFGYSLRGLRLLERQRSAYQLAEVLHSPTFGNVLRLDGAMQCSERDEHFYHEPLVHVAMARASARGRVLVVGGGDGGAAEEVLKWPDVLEVTHVEIDPAVVSLARKHLASVHRGVLDGSDHRYRLVCADGAAFLAQAKAAHYDVILLDLTDAGGPSAALYSRAFYDSCSRALQASGVLGLHIAAPWTQRQTCFNTVAELRRAFDQVHPYLVSVPMSGGQWLMALARNEPVAPEGPRPWATLPVLHDPLCQLKVVSAEWLNTVFILPPYLADLANERSHLKSATHELPHTVSKRCT